MQKIQSFDWLHFKFKFQIQIFKFKTNFVFNLPVFAGKRIFKTYQHFCFRCFHSRWHFFWFHKDREITKNIFTLAENNFGEGKLSCTRLNFGEILFAGTKRAVPGGQYRSILPARLAIQNTEFAAEKETENHCIWWFKSKSVIFLVFTSNISLQNFA